jgi:hypothetical protein
MQHQKRTAAIGLLASAAAAVGIVAATNANSEPNPPPPPAATSGINESGQTFGPGGNVDSIDHLPDLILTRASNGNLGYITKSDFLGPALTLEQVRQLPQGTQDGQPSFNTGPRTVPVYAADGTTVIGEFEKH